MQPDPASTIRLHGYWRSGTSYRTRIALNLKGVEYAQIPHDLRRGDQHAPDYLTLAPQGLVPALEVDALVLTQSPAILEWIEERWPTPPLLPEDRNARAIVRAMAALIGCDIHPLNNLRVLKYLKNDLEASQAQLDVWAGRWIGDGFAALEQMVARHGAGFAYGDRPTLVECYLVPQLYSAERFNVELSAYPRLSAIGERAGALEAFVRAHPDVQPDADVTPP